MTNKMQILYEGSEARINVIATEWNLSEGPWQLPEV